MARTKKAFVTLAIAVATAVGTAAPAMADNHIPVAPLDNHIP
ncbi:hypothetical protein U9R90_30880 [Streptomyces sp. E11-3]